MNFIFFDHTPDVRMICILTEKLIACAIILQAIELLQLRKFFSERGIWSWKTLSSDYRSCPNWVTWIFRELLDFPNFIGLLRLQTISAALVFFMPQCVVLTSVLLLTTLLTSMRFRGSFNGGSDFMTFTVVLSVWLAALFKNSDRVMAGAVIYLGVQLTLSYVIAGVAKLKSYQWRAGSALVSYIQSEHYEVPDFVIELLSRSVWMTLASWTVVLYECMFPLGWLSPIVCVIFLCFSFLFHLTNVVVFGLNRFLFAWLAGYPALYYCSFLLHQRSV